MSAPRKLKPWERSYVRKAIRLRDQLTDKALAGKFRVSRGTLLRAAREA